MKEKYFKVINKGSGTIPAILVYGSIPDRDENYDRINDAGSLVRAITDLESAGNARIDMRFNSPGGSFFDALAVAAAIVRSKAEIHTYNDGIAYSAAFIMFAAGKKRHAAKGSFFMAHNASFSCISGNSKDLGAAAEELKQYDEGAIEMLAGVSKMTADEIRSLYYNYSDVVMGAEKALENGFVEEVLPFGTQNLPSGIENLSLKEVAALWGEEEKQPAASWIDKITDSIKGAFATQTPKTTPIPYILEEDEIIKIEDEMEQNPTPATPANADIEALRAEIASLKAEQEAMKAKPAAAHTSPVKTGPDGHARPDDGVDWDTINALKHNRDADLSA